MSENKETRVITRVVPLHENPLKPQQVTGRRTVKLGAGEPPPPPDLEIFSETPPEVDLPGGGRGLSKEEIERRLRMQKAAETERGRRKNQRGLPTGDED